MSGDSFLSQAEIDGLCEPLKQPAAQIRHLRGLGVHVIEKPNGRAAVVRSHAEAVLSGRADAEARAAAAAPAPDAAAPTPRPNVEGFLRVIKGGKKHGTQKAVQSTESA